MVLPVTAKSSLSNTPATGYLFLSLSKFIKLNEKNPPYFQLEDHILFTGNKANPKQIYFNYVINYF